MIGQMIVLAIVMVLGLSAVLMGGVMVAVGREVVTGALLAGVAAPVTVVCLVRLVRLNRKYQDDALAAVLADPREVVARWASAEGEVILARRGLFVGPSFYPFAGGYQRLQRAAIDAGQLTLEFATVGVASPVRRTVAVPEAALEVVREFVTRRA